MKVIILAAGQSRRLKPLEDKNFLQFLGKPLVQYQLEQLLRVGLKDFIVINGKHNLSSLQKLAKKLHFKITLVEQKDASGGMAAALLSVEKLLKEEPILIISANDVLEPEAYGLILKAAAEEKYDSLMLAKKVKNYFPGGYLKVKKNNLITAIVEKPGEGKEPSDLINLVVHYYRSAQIFLKALHQAQSDRDDRYEVALDNLIQDGYKVKAVPYDGFWQAVKYPWHILSLMDYFLEKLPDFENKKNQPFPPRGKNVEIASSATVRGQVHLADGVKILENAVIIGPAYIGKNTIVATNALVRNSMIGADCIVGFGTEIARSYVGERVWTHSNYIGDSIIADGCSFGAGTITGNLRLDESNIKMIIQDEKIDSGRSKFGLFCGKNLRCGINVSFMPGVKVGSNCAVGAGIVVAQDIPDGHIAYAKTELILKENKIRIDEKKRDKMRKKLKSS